MPRKAICCSTQNLCQGWPSYAAGCFELFTVPLFSEPNNVFMARLLALSTKISFYTNCQTELFLLSIGLLCRIPVIKTQDIFQQERQTNHLGNSIHFSIFQQLFHIPVDLLAFGCTGKGEATHPPTRSPGIALASHNPLLVGIMKLKLGEVATFCASDTAIQIVAM